MGNMVDRSVWRDVVMVGLLFLCIGGVLAFVFLGGHLTKENGPAEVVCFTVPEAPQAVRLTTLEKSLSDIAPALAASGISRLSFKAVPHPSFGSSVAAIGTVDSVWLYFEPSASSIGSAFQFNLVVQGDSLVVEAYETTALPLSVNDAESFIRSLANQAVATIQSRKQYGLQPINK